MTSVFPRPADRPQHLEIQDNLTAAKQFFPTETGGFFVDLLDEPVGIGPLMRANRITARICTREPFQGSGVSALPRPELLYNTLFGVAMADGLLITTIGPGSTLATGSPILSPLRRGPQDGVLAVPHHRSPIQEAVASVRRSLPGWSEERLGSLFGVSRQAWRAWESGSAQPRARARRRIHHLERILLLRGDRTNQQPAIDWFESSVGEGGPSPLDLWRARRDDVVALLAAAVRSDVSRDVELAPTVSLDLSRDDASVADRLEDARGVTQLGGE